MKNILICVTSGIACYKALDLVSKLKNENYNVTVVMSNNATKLISPDLFKIISGNKVYYDLFDDDITVSHIELVKNTDLVVVVPATANIISKISNGIADDFISTLLLACDHNKLLIYPAMNSRMYNNIIIQNNINKLLSYNIKVFKPSIGKLACNEIGIGKLPDIKEIFEDINFILNCNNSLNGINILITSGGTKEYIDTVRFISNISSGKMGNSLAYQAKLMGANVTLITTNKDYENKFIDKIIYCDSANEMEKLLNNNLNFQEYIIMCAAVSDFKIKNYSNKKIKKTNLENFNLELELNNDIIYNLSKIKNRKFKIIGFAAEDDNIIENAKNKLKNKNLDYIILNDISKKDIGFNSDYNEVYIIDNKNNIKKIDKDTKINIAKEILLSTIGKK